MDPVGRYLKARIDEGRMPGAVGAIVGPSGIASEWVLGHAALEPERIEARVDTLYDLASLTKPLCTGLALASLEERGLCALDAPMVEWLPELEHSAYADASLLRFAAHTTGLPAWRPLYLSGNDAATFLSTIAALPAGELGGGGLFGSGIRLSGACDRAHRGTPARHLVCGIGRHRARTQAPRLCDAGRLFRRGADRTW